VELEAERLRLLPKDIAYLTGSRSYARDELPEQLALGRAADGQGRLLLRFALDLPRRAVIQSALLVFEPLPGCAPRPGAIRSSLQHVLEPWSSAAVSAGRQPSYGQAWVGPVLSPIPAKTLRIDVSELVRAWRAHPRRYHGLMLEFEGQSSSGACLSSGLSHGELPHLELFFAPTRLEKRIPPDAAVDGDADADGPEDDEDEKDDDDPGEGGASAAEDPS
jgi:hypothetical protein